MLEKAS
jgi:uncharacterized membrane protein